MNMNCRKRKEKQNPMKLNEKRYIDGKEKSPGKRTLSNYFGFKIPFNAYQEGKK